MSKANKSTQATATNNNNNPTAENEVITMSTELSTAENNITENAPAISATDVAELSTAEGVATDWLVVYPNRQSITVHTPTACTADEVAAMLAQVAIVVLPQPKATRATSGVGTGGSRIPKGLEVRESSVAKPVSLIRGTLADVMAANPTYGTSELVSYYVTTYGIAYHTARTQVQVHKADALATLAKRVPVA